LTTLVLLDKNFHSLLKSTDIKLDYNARQRRFELPRVSCITSYST